MRCIHHSSIIADCWRKMYSFSCPIQILREMCSFLWAIQFNSHNSSHINTVKENVFIFLPTQILREMCTFLWAMQFNIHHSFHINDFKENVFIFLPYINIKRNVFIPLGNTHQYAFHSSKTLKFIPWSLEIIIIFLNHTHLSLQDT